jgi:hypothetical protein
VVPNVGSRPGGVPSAEPVINTAAIAAASEAEQKQMLGEIIYMKIFPCVLTLVVRCWDSIVFLMF